MRQFIPSTAELLAFDAVARLGSFSLAAKELSLTQSAVSRQVAALEAALRAKLFDRSNRRVTLTKTGRQYADEISQALRIIRDATLQIVTNRQDQVLNIAVLPTFGTRWLMPRISGFVAQHPDITLNFTTRIGQFDFTSQGLDIAIYHGLPDWEGVDCTLIMAETMVPVAAADFSGRIEDAQKLTLHSRPDAWQNFGGNTGAGMTFEHFATLSQACIVGIGVALMPEFLIEPELARGDLKAVGDRFVNDAAYYIAEPQKPAQNAAAEKFKNWVLAQV